jgi:Lrp/AsnC family leucine-responsive transcriptional regulator
MEKRDYQILDLLQKDCRISNSELAEQVGMSASSCWRRVRALEEDGVIERYSARINPSKVGMAFQAIVHVQLTRHDPDKNAEFIRVVNLRKEVQECYATTGQADYHLRVLCSDLNAYNLFLEDFLFRLPTVQSAQTNVILREIKRSGAINF